VLDAIGPQCGHYPGDPQRCHRRADPRHGDGVVDVRLAGLAPLVLVGLHGDVEGLADQAGVLRAAFAGHRAQKPAITPQDLFLLSLQVGRNAGLNGWGHASKLRAARRWPPSACGTPSYREALLTSRATSRGSDHAFASGHRVSGPYRAGKICPRTSPKPMRSPSRSAWPRITTVSPSSRNFRSLPSFRFSGRVPRQLSSSRLPKLSGVGPLMVPLAITSP